MVVNHSQAHGFAPRCRSWRAWTSRAVWATAATAIVLFAYGRWRLSQTPAELGPGVCFMPGNSISEESPPNFVEVMQACGPTQRPDWLLWPEFTLSGLYRQAADFDVRPRLQALTQFAQAHDVALIVGCNRREPVGQGTSEFNSVLLANPRPGPVGWYDKMALIPWNEFAPWIAWPGMRVVEGGFEHGQSATIHELWAPSRQKTYRVAATVCYDTCFSWVHRRFFHGGADADVFLACSAESLDGKDRGSRQILALAKLRAVECRRAVARNVFSGISAIIDGNGAVRFQTDNLDQPVLAGNVPIDRRWSFYRELGDWLPVVIFCIWMACQVVDLVLLRQSRTPSPLKS